ncbi:glyoxalase [Paractinoplanes deccanensis]|uniref:Glyoxalase n=1 Tax=Paractinoplanes deccanensis TaxID=113561 RepID=A0ABQ3XX27_9ACTN|nr:VOC family protein [Actinoplanes deccanensis]GID72304.1 glyoxalase [Actinoplanes deccanensis]
MNLVSLRVITADINRLVAFYEKATGIPATWSTPDFAEIGTGVATLAIGSERTVPLFAPGAARAADNHSVIIEFLVPDVDAVHAATPGAVQEPTTMPWGNRSLLVRDPDGNLVNFFTPVTDAAKAKFQRAGTHSCQEPTSRKPRP